MNSSAKQIQSCFDSRIEPFSNFEGVCEEVAMEQSEKLLHHCNLYTHRRANQVLHRDLVTSKSV